VPINNDIRVHKHMCMQTATSLQKEPRNQGSPAAGQRHEAAQVPSKQRNSQVEPETSRTGQHQNGATAMVRNVTVDLDSREAHAQVPRNQATAPKQVHAAPKLARNTTVALDLCGDGMSEEGCQTQIQNRSNDKHDRAQTTSHAPAHASGHRNAAGDRATNNVIGTSGGSSSSRVQQPGRSHNNNHGNMSSARVNGHRTGMDEHRANAQDVDEEDAAGAGLESDVWHSVCVGARESPGSVTDAIATVRTFVPLRASVNRQGRDSVDSYNGSGMSATSAQRQYVDGHANVSSVLCV
jgi:hypothetical protein